MTPTEQKTAAKKFVERWQQAEGSEDREARSYWIELCQNVLGIASPTQKLDFERKVKGRKVDVFYEDMGVLIENKRRGVSLDDAEQRGWLDKAKSVPRMVTPYQQAKWYADSITPRSIAPKWIVTCNFDSIRIYDLDDEDAEDADLLHERNASYNYLKNFQVLHMRQALIDLFAVLKTPEDERDPYLSPEPSALPYVNGGLFAADITIPQFTQDTRFILLQEASADFDWSGISPTIFGAVFESTLNPETRRSGECTTRAWRYPPPDRAVLYFSLLRMPLTVVMPHLALPPGVGTPPLVSACAMPL